MKNFFFYIVKYIKWIYTLYFYIGNACVHLLKMFVRPDDKLLLFVSFGGRRFDDSPKVIYKELLKDKRFDGYKLVWAFNNPEEYVIERGEKVKTDTLKYFVTALKARVWVTNSTVERGLSFKGRNTLFFNTWHGTPLKKMGSDIVSNNTSFKGRSKFDVDFFTVQGDYEAEIFMRVFRIRQEAIAKIGLPRNDIYMNYTEEYAEKLRRKLNIPPRKKVILYAPTFREYESEHGRERVLNVPITLSKWEEILGEEYVLLFRAHYEVAKSMSIIDNAFVKDMSLYPQLDDLMIISDILVSDYSSIFFDYSIMHKPMLTFCYDYDRYAKERGMYFDIRDYLPNAVDEDSLIKLVMSIDTTAENSATKAFQEKFVTEYGAAAKKSLNIIYENIK